MKKLRKPFKFNRKNLLKQYLGVRVILLEKIKFSTSLEAEGSKERSVMLKIYCLWVIR